MSFCVYIHLLSEPMIFVFLCFFVLSYLDSLPSDFNADIICK